MIWFIALAIIGLIVYTISKDFNEDIEKNLKPYGGMEGKYATVIQYLIDGGYRLTHKSRTTLVYEHKFSTLTLDYVGGDLEIRALLGNGVSKLWKFRSGMPQSLIIGEIESWFRVQLTKLMIGN